MTGLKTIAAGAAVIGWVAALVTMTTGTASAQLPGTSAAVVCLYTDANFRGRRLCVEEKTNLPRLINSQDNRTSSFRISPGWGLKVCRDREFGGWCRYFSGDVRRLADSNDKISSIEVFRLLTSDPAPPPPPPPPPPVASGVVCLYSDPDYRGDPICVDDEIQVRRLQPWDDNRVSSFRVNDGYVLRACRDANFGGWCREFTGDEPNLRASNDAISSFQVSRVVVDPPALRIACLFTEPEFGGLAVCSEQAEQISNFGPRLDNQISSIRLAAGWSMVVCNRPNQRGQCLRIDEDRPRLGLAFDNQTSSYRVFETASLPPAPPPPPEPPPQPPGGIINLPGLIGAIAGEICFYEHADFRGRKMCRGAGADVRNLDPINNNQFSSVRVPNGLVVVGCENRNFAGQCRRYTRDLRFLGPGFNDRISSYRVMPDF